MDNRLLAELIRRGGLYLVNRVVKRVAPTKPVSNSPLPRLETKTIASPIQPPPPVKSSLAKSLSGAALTRLATRSVPGAIIIGGGLLAKLAYDRKKARERRNG